MHVAVIMDGNGRWATARGLSRSAGHRAGMEKVIEIVEWADESDVDTLTLYAFSTENWKRPKNEVGFLMDLLVFYLNRELNRLHEKNVRIHILGDINELPEKCRVKLEEAVSLTSKNTGLVVNFAINYSAWSELVRAINHIHESKEFIGKSVTERDIRTHLYTGLQKDPDLMIRTGGQKRLSNFLLMQSAYTEFIFVDTHWPDITHELLNQCLDVYHTRKRNFGGL
ncbi:MAG: polyprenyl diphosphate synthase [Tissierellia bacterium]|nr:polyprenyl diphosphate synthase [Tissierellia bacterium]